MKVLVVGSGAREHAIVWKLRQSPRLTDLFIAPGNAGTAAIAENLPIKASDIDGICDIAKQRSIDLVVVGPEDPLARGLVDRLVAVARTRFDQARDALPEERGTRRLLLAAEIMGAVYARVLDRVVARCGRLDVAARLRVSKPKKLVLALRTWWRGRRP